MDLEPLQSPLRPRALWTAAAVRRSILLARRRVGQRISRSLSRSRAQKRELETDYLVVGAGASGMAFTDTLLAESDADVVLVDRRHQPGGHWLDAYPFVRLHQPSAYYGVNSMMLGNDRIDDSGENAGFYERASAADICDYYSRVLDERLLPTGGVRFLGMSNCRGGDGAGHHIVSLLDGVETVVRVRRRVIDATYVESQIPSRHTGFTPRPGG